MKAYITGSRAYGTPKEDSDVDLVIAADANTICELWDLSDQPDGKLMFGKLNLVVFNTEKEEERERYERWKAAHDRLVARAPVTKDEAIKEFRDAGAESVYLRPEYPELEFRDADISDDFSEQHK